MDAYFYVACTNMFLVYRATRVVALHVANNLKIAQFLPSNVKSVLITLLGRRGALTGPVLRSLAHRDLQVVNLSGSLVRDSTVKILQYLTKLKSLYIPSHKISTMGNVFFNISVALYFYNHPSQLFSVLVELFPCLPFLEDLDTSSSEQVNDQVLVSLGNSCPLLRLVNLGKCPSFTDAGLAHLVACLYSLTVLDISHSQVSVLLHCMLDT